MLRIALAFLVLSSWAAAATIPAPPATKTDNVIETIHGVTIADPYRWLEDQNSPATRAWIDGQMKYTASILDKLPGRERIRRRLEELTRVETVSTPVVEGGRYFFTRRLPNQNQAVLYVRDGLNGKDEVLVDPNSLSSDQSTAVSLLDVSRDGKILAYGLRHSGEDETTMTFLDVDTRRELTDKFPRARYFGVSIAPDHGRMYYATFSQAAGPRIYVHRMGADPKTDAEIFGKGYGARYIISCNLSDDGRYLIFHVSLGSGARTEIYVQDVANHGPVIPVVKGIDAIFGAQFGGDRLYLHTNWKAPNWHVLEVDLNHPESEHWKEVIPEGPDPMTGFSAVGGHLAAAYLHDVTSRIEIHEANGKPVRSVKLPSLGTASAPFGHWNSNEAFYGFTSFVEPHTIYRYDIASGEQTVWFRGKSGLEAEQFQTAQVWYASKDKTRVPMFVVHKKGIALDGSHPALMTAYGGFNISITPSYSPFAAAFLEEGGIYAVPNLRGGVEFGEKWHKAGMLGNKQHVFDDFFAAAEYLIEHGYTKPSHLAIEGRSNGGLLMGAAMTQRPDLYRAIICGFPLLDMVRYDKFKVAKWWVPEYGSASDAKQFQVLYAYSPYHHVKKDAKYPAILFITGDSDTRVDPLHARKMTALMQASSGSGLPVLLRYDTKAGHSSGGSVSQEIDLMTDEMGFLMWQLGMNPAT